jgi:hypothetical protein
LSLATLRFTLSERIASQLAATSHPLMPAPVYRPFVAYIARPVQCQLTHRLPFVIGLCFELHASLTVGFVAIQPERDGPPARACGVSGGGYVERN